LKIPYVLRVVKATPEIEIEIDGQTVKLKGPNASLSRSFAGTPLMFRLDGSNTIIIEAKNIKKRDAALVGTAEAHIKNMLKGVTKGFTYKLKTAYAHFPMNIKIEQDKVKIENFIGERAPRVARIEEGVQVTLDGEDVVVTGADKEKVSQTAANIQKITKIKEYDPRVFSDGIFLYSKE
jgi:large subunit ribosomal protein L6